MQAPKRIENELPPLTYSSLARGHRFAPTQFVVTEQLVREFSAITNDANPLYHDRGAARRSGLPGPVMPPGLTGVWARRAYLGRNRMLPGGVMAGQTYELRAPVPIGTALLLEAEVIDIDPDDPRRRVVLSCAASAAGIGSVGAVQIDARWPKESETGA
jgi:acyl dehydratase